MYLKGLRNAPIEPRMPCTNDSLDPVFIMTQISHTAITALRKHIRDGRYQPGEKLREVQVAELLGVSRTPVRLAFRTLEQEGLLERTGKQGYVVREVSADDVLCGVEIRGVLEGLAARRLAERGLSAELKDQLERCVQEGDELINQPKLSQEDIERWGDINARFHALIVNNAGSRAISDAITRNNHLPFASSDSITIDTDHLAQEQRKLQVAQLQHQLVVQALVMGESTRAEMLMREHAYIGLRYGPLFGVPEGMAL